MRCNAQRDGCPLGGSELRSGPIFRRLWTKVIRIKSVVCNASKTCCVMEIFAIKSRSCQKSRRILMFWGRQISGEGATQISDRIL